jgi:uncharacterized protein
LEINNYISRLNNNLKKLILPVLIFLTHTLFATPIPPKPDPPRLVNDYANFLKIEEIEALEQKSLAFYKQSSTQIVTVIVPDLNGYDPAQYAFELGEKWGVGKKGKNNGVILLVSLNPKKIFIATGYGTEEFLTDAYCKRIVETIIKPQFKQGNYAAGLEKGLDAIILTLQNKFTPDSPAQNNNGFFTLFIIIIFLIIIFIISKKIKPSNNYHKNDPWRGGGWGGGFTTFSSGRNIFGGGLGSQSGGFDGFGGGSFGGGGAGGSW